MQNVNISCDESKDEYWTIQEIYKNVDEYQENGQKTESTSNQSYMNDITVNSEEELYVKGCTAVWTRGTGGPESVLPRTCFTCESTIKHAFFCSPNFIKTEEPDKRTFVKNAQKVQDNSVDAIRGVCLIGKITCIFIETI